MPRARPWKVTSEQVEPGSMRPMNVNVPLQPGPPPNGPVARKLIATGEGVFVIPGCWTVTPVGLSGVPPQVQVVAACAEAATALADPHNEVIASAQIVARDRMSSALPVAEGRRPYSAAGRTTIR